MQLLTYLLKVGKQLFYYNNNMHWNTKIFTEIVFVPADAVLTINIINLFALVYAYLHSYAAYLFPVLLSTNLSNRFDDARRIEALT